jgi:small conductance mechanosensitive channel
MSLVSGSRAAEDLKSWGALVILALAFTLEGLAPSAWGAASGTSLFGAPGIVPSTPNSAVSSPGTAAPAPIMVGQRQLFSVGALPGETAAQRAASINRRIASFVSHPEQIAPIVVQIRGRERILAAAGRDLLTVTPQDAADNLTSVPELADSWRQELDQALSTVQAEHQTLWIQMRDSIVLSAEDLLRQCAAFIPRFASALVVLLVTWFTARGVRTAVRRLLEPAHLDLNTQQLIRTLTYYGIWTLGWVLALGTAGIQPATLVAGLGVTTLALGFALKDLLSNVVSGFLILTTRPFNLGDQIAMKEFEGTVERIELRATHLRTADNRLIIIPNADLYIATITNNTASPCRRQEFLVGIDYAADLNQAFAVALRVTQETPGVLPDPAPDVLVHELASSSVHLKIRFHTDPRRGNAMTVGSQVKQRVKEAFDAAGIAIYPPGTQIVQLQAGESAALLAVPGSSESAPQKTSASPAGGPVPPESGLPGSPGRRSSQAVNEDAAAEGAAASGPGSSGAGS